MAFHSSRFSGFGSALGLFLALTAHADGIWKAGLMLQGVVDFAPGNELLYGIEGGYSDSRILNEKLELQGAYLTNRIEASYRNVPPQDWFILSPVWHFRRLKLFDPVLQIDAGYQRYELSDDEVPLFGNYLQTDTWLYGVKAGFQLHFGKAERYTIAYALGFQQATASSSEVQPLPFSLALEVSFP